MNDGQERIATILKNENLRFRSKFPSHPALNFSPYVNSNLEGLDLVRPSPESYKKFHPKARKKANIQGERKVFFGASLGQTWKIKF